MKTKLTCSVCDRASIEGDICPNCETNLSLMRMLLELPNERRGIPLFLATVLALICLVIGVVFF